MATLVGAIEASRDDVALARAKAGAAVADAHNGFAGKAHQGELYSAALGRELDGVVDQIGDRLEQEVPVAAHRGFDCRCDLERNALVLGDRLVKIAHLTHDIRQGDVAKPLQAPALLDLRNSQQRRDDRQRLVESADGLINNGPQLLQRLCISASALEPDPHARERCAQLVRDVVTDAGDSLNQRLDLVEHPVDDDGELIEWIIETLGRQALAQFARNDAPHSSVDLPHPVLGPQAQEHSGHETETQGRNEPHDQSSLHDRRELGELVDVPPKHQDFAAAQPAGDRTDGLLLAAPGIDADNRNVLRVTVDSKTIRQTLQVASDATAISTKEPGKPDATRILAQALVDRVMRALRNIARDGVRVSRDRAIDAARQV